MDGAMLLVTVRRALRIPDGLKLPSVVIDFSAAWFAERSVAAPPSEPSGVGRHHLAIQFVDPVRPAWQAVGEL
jgi:hypothetical protein